MKLFKFGKNQHTAIMAGFLILYSLTAHAESTTKVPTVPYVETNLIPEFNSIIAGQTLYFAISQKHTEGWHTYWKNPGDSGETLSIEWSVPEGFKPNDIIYPAPSPQPTGPLMNFGYSGENTLLTSIDIPKNITADTVTINAKLSWLVCHDICIPETKDFSISLPVTNQDIAPAHPALFEAARLSIPESKAWQGTIEEMNQNIIITYQLDDEGLLMLKDSKNFLFFPEEWGLIKYAAPQDIKVTDNKLVVKLERDSRALNEIQTLNSVLTYEDNSGAKKSVALSVAVMPKSAISGGAEAVPEKSSFVTPPSFIQAIFLAILGGFILNLMPCVFPVLSIKTLSLIKMSDREQRHANLHGIFYTLGILVCFGVIAGLLIILKSAGQQIGWGFQLQNPIVILLLAYLLFAMALNLSGFFEIKSGPLANIGHKLASHHGYKGSFFTGVLATIVATPCTAPFMATAMGYALTQPPFVALTIFMALGFGLALPYLLLCFIPPLRKSLPKPGAWMETFRQFMSFPLFASVAWLIWVYTQQVDGSYGTLLGLAGLILIAFGIWISRHEPKKQPWKTGIHALSIGSIILAFVIAGLSHTNATPSKTDDMAVQSMNHTAYSVASLEKLLAGNDPIFVDMTAAWCITCKVNERIAIMTDATQDLFKRQNVQLVIGDWTNQNPEITKFLADYGRNGVPLYVFYGARNLETGKRPEPKILPQILTSGIISEFINGEE